MRKMSQRVGSSPLAQPVQGASRLNQRQRRRRLASSDERPANDDQPQPKPQLKRGKVVPTGSVFVVDDHPADHWAPSTFTAFRALLSARLCAAVWSLIADCDETFNYWEPTHFLIYRSSGFQTWEYSPVYALRSYFYVLIHALPGSAYAHLFQADKVLVFCFIRCHLGMAAAFCEAYFYKAVRERFGGHVARTMLAFSLFASGMFVSSAAYLPSTFSMYFTMLAIAAWLLGKHAISILCVAISAFVGWPFAAVLGIGIAVDIVIRQRRIAYFAMCSFASLLLILVPLVMVDSQYYGKTVVAPLNIVLYNVLSSGRGPELYGTEPLSFYFVNCFLNFNFVFVAALVSAPLMIVEHFYTKRHSSQAHRNNNVWLMLLPMYTWMLIFFSQAHKEERFLFPIYPLFCFAGAVACVTLEKMVLNTIPNKWSSVVRGVRVTFVLLCTALAVSRSLALYHGYRAPFDVFMEVNRLEQEMKPHSTINLCMGKEWHRYPSSFFMPDNWSLQFIQSEFRGQLPKQYSKVANATSIVPDFMNDANREEPSRYMDIEKCHYLVDLDVETETQLEPRFSHLVDEWEVVFATPFLETFKSPSPWRSFYIPWLTPNKCLYADYVLLKSKENKVKFQKVKSKLAY